MAPGKKNATRLGAYLVFVDEAGFLLVPPVRKTWGPRGQTPFLRPRARRDQLSVISGLSVSPRRQRLGRYFQWHRKNLQQAEACTFLRHLLRHLPGPHIVVWDNSRPHRGDPIRQLCRRHPRLHLEAFPAYAPELNPDEGVWTHTKGALANSRPDTLDALEGHLAEALADLRASQQNLKGRILQSDLPPFLR